MCPVGLLEFRGLVHRVSDDGVLEPIPIAHRAEDDGAVGDRRVHPEAGPALFFTPGVPLRGGGEHSLHRAQGVGRRGLGGAGRAERGHDAVAHELVDGPAVRLNGGDESALIFGEHRDHFPWRHGVREPGEAPDVAEQDGGLAGFSGARFDRLLRGGDPVRDLGGEESGEVARRLALCGRAHDQAPRSGHCRREDGGHHQDGDDLVRLRADQDRVRRHVFHVVPGDHPPPAGGGHGVCGKRRPAGRGGDPRGHDVTGAEGQHAQPDEDEDVDHGRSLEIEGRRLAVFDVEGPDEAEEQSHVHDDGQVLEPGIEPLAPCEIQAGQGEQDVAAEDEGNEVLAVLVTGFDIIFFWVAAEDEGERGPRPARLGRRPVARAGWPRG